MGDAVAEMFLDQAEGDRLEGLGNRSDLSEDVDAVLVFVDHPLQPAHLALDPAEPPLVAVLVMAVPVHNAPRLVCCARLPSVGSRSLVRGRCSRRLLATTKAEESVIAAEAMTGLRKPAAASGIAAAL